MFQSWFDFLSMYDSIDLLHVNQRLFFLRFNLYPLPVQFILGLALRESHLLLPLLNLPAYLDSQGLLSSTCFNPCTGMYPIDERVTAYIATAFIGELFIIIDPSSLPHVNLLCTDLSVKIAPFGAFHIEPRDYAFGTMARGRQSS